MGWLVLRWMVLIAAALPWIYYLLAIYSAWRFFRERQQTNRDFTPPVSLLKPVHGLDREAYENLSSFCRLDYPDYEILFGANDETDPMIPIIERLKREFPERSIRLLVGSEGLGPNRKASKLAQMVRAARHDLLVASDSDIRVEPGYLRAVVAPLRASRVGAVTCLYRGLTDDGLASDLEAIGLSADFHSGVLVARQLEGIRFTLGATMATTRARLGEIGGFEALADYCADDFELGHRLAGRGHEVVLSREIVATVFPSETLHDYFAHQFRWALSTRHSRPWGYVGMVFTQGLPWAAAAGAVTWSAPVLASYLTIYLALRLAMAWTIGIWGMKDPLLGRKWWLLPLRDALAFGIWLAAFFGRTVKWRDQEFSLERGRLVPKSPV